MCRRQRPQRTFKALLVARVAEGVRGIEHYERCEHGIGASGENTIITM